jgi:N-acetyltransferase
VRAEAFRPPQTLRGRYVELVPLELSHLEGLLHAARDPEVSRYLVAPIGPARAEAEGTLRLLLERQRTGTDLAFTTRRRTTGAIVGMTRFLHINPEDDSVEIGGTFLDSVYWRSPLNTDAKLAQLRHAFDEGEAHRVTLQTDLRNERSQRAIARLGAVREGLHREDRRLGENRYRTSVVFSILRSEWPAVRLRLEAALERPWSGAGIGEPSPTAPGPS